MNEAKGKAEMSVPTEAMVAAAQEAWTAARQVAAKRYQEYARLRDERSATLGAPQGWEPIAAPAGYRKAASCPPWVKWLRSIHRTDEFVCTTRDPFRYASIAEAIDAGYIVTDDAWMRFVRNRFPRSFGAVA